MSDPQIPPAAEATALEARLALRAAKLAGRRAGLSEEKRALLGKLVQGRVEAAPATIGRRGEAGPAVLSFAQERLWFFARLEPESPLYNLPSALRLTGRLDLPVLARSLGEIFRRHEVLRTTFVAVDGEPRQRVGPARPAALPVLDLPALPTASR